MDSQKMMYYLQSFKLLAKDYWHSEEKWKAYGILAIVLILNLASVFLTVLINDWYKEFWDVLQGRLIRVKLYWHKSCWKNISIRFFRLTC